jgi:hypothetical protein
MTAAPPFAFPGSRTLAGWWRQLASFHPRTLGVAHLPVHRVEALVRLQRRCPLDPVARLVLETLFLEPPPTLPQIQAVLPMERPVLRQVLHGLQVAGLAKCNGEGTWLPTDVGRQAQELGSYPQPADERRAFYFLESEGPDQAPRFIQLANAATTSWPIGGDWKFDVGCLMRCVREPAEWKRRHGFPLEVDEILAPVNSEASGLSAWKRVILDQPEHLVALLMMTTDESGAERLLGFGVQPKGWTLSQVMPVFELAHGWTELVGESVVEPPLDLWRKAWNSWGQANNLTSGEVESCILERRDHRLRVSTSRVVLDRLRSAKSEALRGEAWLLAGTDRIRVAAQLEIVEGQQKK